MLLTADDVRGFFGDTTQSVSEKITLAGVPEVTDLPQGNFADVGLQVINFRHEVIGYYYIGRAWFGKFWANSEREGLVDLEASFYGYSCPYIHAGTIWRRWAEQRPLNGGEWLEYPVDFHASWLHVVQAAWFESGRGLAERNSRNDPSIDGNRMPTVAGFYCALGEAINGVGGYFGSNLDGMADCLAAKRNVGGLANLTWLNYSASCRMLGEEFAASVVTIMREFDVEIALRK